MNQIQITSLSPPPKDEHFQLGLKWWQQTIALSLGRISMTSKDDPRLSLTLDALFLALRLTDRMKNTREQDTQRLNRITGKAWNRYKRRAGLVEGLEVV